MRLFVLPLVLLLALSGCVQPPVKMVLSAEFKASEAQYILEKGTGTLRGDAFLRQNGGGVVTCAGSDVRLIPATTYAQERFRFIYQSDERGYQPVSYKVIPIQNEKYASLQKKTKCDAQGKFIFLDLSAGSYFVLANVNWIIAGIPQGGSVFQKVEIKLGQTNEIVLSP